jgi:hypothetical protein
MSAQRCSPDSPGKSAHTGGAESRSDQSLLPRPSARVLAPGPGASVRYRIKTGKRILTLNRGRDGHC